MRHESAVLQPAMYAGETVMATERSKVVSLWHERARRLGLSERLRPDFSALSRRALVRLTEQHRALYTHALPVMELLHQQILNTHSMVLLTDERGLVMHALGDGDFLHKAEQVALKPGVSWAEESKGTNAIGTALTEQRATLVHGNEHFLAVNRFLTCSCCPIRGPHGELIGSLDVSGPQEGYHPHTMGLVRMSTQMIENHLFVDHFGHALRIHFHPRAELLGTLLEGIIACDETGHVLAANPNALTVLGLDAGEATVHSVSSLFDVDVPALIDQCGAVASVARLTLQTGVVVSARIEPTVSTVGHATRRVDSERGSPRAPDGLWRSRTGASDVRRRPTLCELDTGDPAVSKLIDTVRRVQGRGVPMLILGETGTGKELLAHAIHNESVRCNGPFVAVDCASFPESLIEAELFGYEPGAFTGARRRGQPGQIILADGGTLFLDEIGDMPLALQTRLLRVLQERMVSPLGAGKARSIDIEVLCATNRDLKDMVQRGTFRADLYYRLNGLALRLPPLRERQDLECLVTRILRAQSAASPSCTPEVLEAFRRYGWPGNIRQLAHVLRAAGIMAEHSAQIALCHLPDGFLEELSAPSAPGASMQAAPEHAPDLKALRRGAVAAELRRNGGNISATARALGVSRNTVYRAIRAFRSV